MLRSRTIGWLLLAVALLAAACGEDADVVSDPQAVGGGTQHHSGPS